MRANEVKIFLNKLYTSGLNQLPVLLLGGPGIGKSTCVREFAEETARKLGREFVDYEDPLVDKILADPERYFVYLKVGLAGTEPSDLQGFPRIRADAARYFPLEWVKILSKCPGVLFLDDFLDVPDRKDVLAQAYRISLDRRVGYTFLHPGVQVVAASNTPDTSSLSQLMPLPLANRFIILEVSVPTVDEWATWMDTEGFEWDRRVFAFLKRFEDSGYIYKPPEAPETLGEYPTPRSWTNLARLLARGIEGPQTIEGLIGAEMAQKFGAFLKLDVDIEELAKNPSRFSGLSLDAKYMAVVELATAIGKNITQWLPLIDAMAKDSREWLVILVICMSPRKKSEFLEQLIKQRPEFATLLEKVIQDRGLLLRR
ncbi:MAG: hypothetical protein QW356_02015 [Candidatus Hadarchaeales archaeon]